VSEADVEYVLTLVVRVEKNARPAQTDALETAARAVLAILSDERSTGEGEWAEAMTAWQDARIRKVVRRARGAEWRRAEVLPGITVTGTGALGADASASGADVGGAGASGADAGGGAEVRVFPPVPLDDVPKDLAKLQVTGTDFEDPDELPALEPGVPVLWINPALEMSSGKAMAQCGHAAHLAWLELSPEGRKVWAAADFALAVRTASPAQWQTLLTSGLPVVQDAGFTEVAPGSRTVIAAHPLLTR
jgi:peptidyl-tRNA hydrolase